VVQGPIQKKDCISYARKERLDRIAACETPNANATVRRMARIARGEVE